VGETMTIKEKVKRYFSSQKQILQIQKLRDKLPREIEQAIKKSWRQKGSKLHFDIYTCYDLKFKLEIEDNYARRGKQWFISTETGSNEYVYRPTTEPKDFKKLQSFAKEMQDNLGVEIDVVVHKIPSVKQQAKVFTEYGVISSFCSLDIYYNLKLEHLISGSVLHNGFDSFYVATHTVTNQLIIAYSTNSRDETCIMENPSLAERIEFYKYIEKDERNKAVRNTVELYLETKTKTETETSPASMQVIQRKPDYDVN
jgi:hypothetical protein